MTVWPVLVDSWQIECCGDPPAVGAQVGWRLQWRDAAGSDLPDELHVRRTMTVSAQVLPGGPVGGAPGVVLTAEGLTAWLPDTELPVGPRTLRGLLREDHHIDLPEGLASTSGRVRRVRVLSCRYQPEGGDTRGWVPVPGTVTLREVERSPKRFAHPDFDALQVTGETGVLVDLEVTPPAGLGSLHDLP